MNEPRAEIPGVHFDWPSLDESMREGDVRSVDRVVDTDVRLSDAAKQWTAAVDRVYAERVRDVLTAGKG